MVDCIAIWLFDQSNKHHLLSIRSVLQPIGMQLMTLHFMPSHNAHFRGCQIPSVHEEAFLQAVPLSTHGYVATQAFQENESTKKYIIYNKCMLVCMHVQCTHWKPYGLLKGENSHKVHKHWLAQAEMFSSLRCTHAFECRLDWVKSIMETHKPNGRAGATGWTP